MIEPHGKKCKNCGLQIKCVCYAVHETDDAKIAIIRCVQIQTFDKEMCILRSIQISNPKVKTSGKGKDEKKMEVKMSSSIYRVSPFLDQNILRVGGGLRHGDFTEQMKHHYISPRQSHVTTLLIRHINQKLGHARRRQVLA